MSIRAGGRGPRAALRMVVVEPARLGLQQQLLALITTFSPRRNFRPVLDVNKATMH